MSPVRFVNPAFMMTTDLPESPITPLNYCTSQDGKFDDTRSAEMEAAIAEYAKVCDSKTLALFFHGGLVEKATGLKGAATLVGPYSKPGAPGGNAYPYFFVWESGLFELLQHHLPQIAGETVFQRLLDIIGSKSQSILGGKAGPATSVAALRTPSIGVTVGPVATGTEVSQADIAEVETAVENDPLIRIEKKRIAARAVPVHDALAAAQTARTRLVETSTVTLLSPDIVNAIVAEEAQENAIGEAGLETLWSPVSVGILALRSGKALVRIVQRYAAGRNHNFHNTVVEEILRQFYLADAGGRVWAEMKKETSDAFQDDPGTYVGFKMVQQLIALYDGNKRPRITLLGHSTGAVYICEFLKAMDAALQSRAYRGEIKFDVVFMAPAVRVDYFAKTLAQVGDRIGSFRTFGMHDNLESAEILIQLDGQPPTSPVNQLLAQIYTSSLLYFVSGVCEDPDNDTPLVGMERFFAGTGPFQSGRIPAIDAVTAFYGRHPNAVIWSKTPPNAGAGLECGAYHHGGFPVDEETLRSVCYLLRTGNYG